MTNFKPTEYTNIYYNVFDYPENICKPVFDAVYGNKFKASTSFDRAGFKEHEKKFIELYDLIIEKWNIFGIDDIYRKCIELHYKNKFSIKESSEKMDIGISNFRDKIKKGMKVFSDLYETLIDKGIDSLDFLIDIKIHNEEKGTVYTDIREVKNISTVQNAIKYFMLYRESIPYVPEELSKCFCRKDDGTIKYTIYLVIKYWEYRIELKRFNSIIPKDEIYFSMENEYVKKIMPKELKDKLSSILGKFDFSYINNVNRYEEVYEKEEMWKLIQSEFIMKNLDINKLASLIKAYRSFE